MDLVEKSYALERAGRIGEALALARQALELARLGGEAESVAAARVCLANIHFRQGHYDRARALAEDALAVAPPESPPSIDGLILLGLCAAETDDLAAAESLWHAAIDQSRQMGYRRALRRALHNLAAGVYVPRGQFDLALAADEESFRLAMELEMPEAAWFSLATMGWVYWLTGRREQALETAETLRRFARPGSLAEGFYCCLSADLAQEGESPESALPLYGRARSIAEAIGDPGLGVLLRLGLARYHCAAGDGPAAHDWASDGLALAVRVGYRHLQGMALVERARASRVIGDLAAAQADLEAAIEVLGPLGADFDLARALLLLAATLHQRRHADARAVWIEAGSRIIGGGYVFLLERERPSAMPLLAFYLNEEGGEARAVADDLLAHLLRLPPPPLRILTLGRFQVQQAGRTIPAQVWRRRRGGELFRLLLVSPGRSLSWEQVIEALWPAKPPGSARALLHQATSALRRVLEPDLPARAPSRYLEVEEGWVALHLPPGSWVDFEVMEQRVRAGEWEAALELYGGELFPGDRYADWAAPLRERLARQYVRAALAVARQQLAGRPERALEVCRQVLAVEPWQEEATLLGMRACVALHDRAGAVQLYRDLERRLREELDIAPQTELQRYYHTLL